MKCMLTPMMASPHGEQLSDIDDKQRECAICMDVFVDPCKLPCSHTFCRQCLVRHYESSSLSCMDRRTDETVNCPTCRQTWPFPCGSRLDHFPAPEHLKNLLDNAGMSELPQTSSGNSLTDKETPGEDTSCAAIQPVVVYCDACGSPADEADEERDMLTVGDAVRLRWCVECSQTLCCQCVIIHARLTSTRSHCVVSLPSRNHSSLTEDQLVGVPCTTHVHLTTDLFCWHCRQLVCLSCATSTQHRDHSCDDVALSTARLRTLLTNDARSVEEQLHRCNAMESDVDAEKSSWMSNIEAVDNEIRLARDSLRALVDQHCAAVRDQLVTTKQLRFKQLSTRAEDLAVERSRLNSLSKNIHTIIDHPTDMKLLLHADDLHQSVMRRLAEILPSNSFRRNPFVFFTPAEVRTGTNLIGHVELVDGEVAGQNDRGSGHVVQTRDSVPSAQPLRRVEHPAHTPVPVMYYRKLLNTIADQQVPVCGLAVVADRLYVCHGRSPHVYVYFPGGQKYRRVRSIHVPKLNEPSDMAGTCGGGADIVGRLFVCSETDGVVFRVTLLTGPDDVVDACWSTDDRPYSVCANEFAGRAELLVLSREAATVSVLDDCGRQLRRLRLPSSVSSPWAAVRLPSTSEDPAARDVVVCHGDLTNDDDGQLRRCVTRLDWSTGTVRRRHEWLRTRSANRHQSTSVVHLVLEDSDGGGGFLVADEGDDRVRRVDADLSIDELVLQTSSFDADDVIEQPRRLCVDSQRQRLLVGLNDGRVQVFTNDNCVVM